MKPAAPLAVLMLSLTLAACGGGGTGKTVITPAGEDITSQPVAQDGSSLNAAVSAGRGFYQVDLASLEDRVGQVTLRSDFSVELAIGTRRILDFGDAASFASNAADRQSLAAYHAAGERAVILLNTPNGADDASGRTVAGALDFATYGVWLTGSELDLLTSRTALQTTDFGAFYGGIPTALAGMPTTGSATYTGGVVAAEFDRGAGRSQILTGPMRMTADFAAGRMSGQMDLNLASGATFTQLRTNDVRISGNTFAGSVTSTTGHAGSLDGVFAGEAAAEIAGGFALDGGDSQIRGAFGGAR